MRLLHNNFQIFVGGTAQHERQQAFDMPSAASPTPRRMQHERGQSCERHEHLLSLA